MRIALLLILTATALLAFPTLPSVERSVAVFTGRVLSTQKVRVAVDKEEGSLWELWKAEVRVQTVVTQDVALAKNVFVYYAQDWSTNYVTADGTHVRRGSMVACPARPSLTTNDVYKFFCIRHDVDDDKRLLFIPQGGWAIRQ